MRSLQQFAGNGEIFPEATELPQFFQHNLVDDARVVKHFQNDPQATIRVFYYQYLKLCFEIESVDFEGYIHKIEEVINNQDFKFVFFEDDDPSIFNDQQFKLLIMQFFGVLGAGNYSIEQALIHFPIVDTVFIYFFRAMLILTGKTDSLDSYIERQDLLQFLCEYFGVEISLHDKCVKFVETDIFVYQEDPKDVYMAYMDYERTINQPQPSQIEQSPSYNAQNNVPAVDFSQNSHQEISVAPASSSSRRGYSEAKESYIASEFLDYTSTANLTSLVKPQNLKDSGSIDPKLIIHNKDHFGQHKIEQPNVVISAPIPGFDESSLRSSPISYNSSYSQQEDSKIVSKPVVAHQSNLNHLDYFNKYADSNKSSTNNYTSYGWQASQGVAQQKGMSHSSSSTFELQKNNQITKKPYVYEAPTYPALSSMDTYRTNQSSYTSNNSEINHQVYESKQSIGYQQIVAPPPYKPQPVYQPVTFNTIPSVSATKSPFNLNVSLQFTNSFTMKAMCEPHKTNTFEIRKRARNYRDSLKSFLK